MIDLAPSLAASRPMTGAFLPVAAVMIALEFLTFYLRGQEARYDLRETMATAGVAFGDLAMRVVSAAVLAVPFAYVYEHRLFDIPASQWWTWPAAFLAVEFAYYWQHRASHEIRWMWATHSVHHSATRFNLSAALRLGWTGLFSGNFLFFLPLAWIGFHPLAIFTILGAGLVYQFFLHTAADVRLGWFEAVLNTPAHHKVHHASNDQFLDKNYGSVLIVFDRLFGTFAKAGPDDELRFGLKSGAGPAANPIAIAFGEWRRMWNDLRKAGNARQIFGALFGRP